MATQNVRSGWADTLDSAVAVFRTHGFSGSSISQLVEATGKSRSTLYREFGDKDGLFVAALAHYVDSDQFSSDLHSATEMSEPCLLTRSCNELGDIPAAAASLVADVLERQWVAFLENEPAPDLEDRATLALATRHGLATLAAAGVPSDLLGRAAVLL